MQAKQFHTIYSLTTAYSNDIIKKIELLLETSYLLDTNANIPLLMDSMMYRI